MALSSAFFFYLFVIQSEAKNLSTSTNAFQILPPYGRLDDRMFRKSHFDTHILFLSKLLGTGR